ncbi:MAG: arsenate reductase family protein [Clostridiaceae bacterium]
MKSLFIEYPSCTTCKKAKKWLVENQIEFDDRHIAENKPSREELKQWFNKSGLPINKFFNTSGKLYKEMNLKDKVKTATIEELLDLLATDGMLVKRPILLFGDKVLVGFKEDNYKELLR